ncbi:hypothetical protein ACXPWS_13645 [Mycobacterium sp. BMJ-28]
MRENSANEPAKPAANNLLSHLRWLVARLLNEVDLLTLTENELTQICGPISQAHSRGLEKNARESQPPTRGSHRLRAIRLVPPVADGMAK